VRYVVSEYVPGVRVAFRFEGGGITAGFDGGHTFEVIERDGGVVLRHEIDAECSVPAWLRWVLSIRILHDALIEDAFDRAARALGGEVRSIPWGRSVRVLRRIAARANA
jgi:hypothetical protein